LRGISFDAGKEFDVVAVSFDARENGKTELVKNKKEAYLKRYERPNTANGWHFLTGAQSEIDKLTQAVGFNYEWDERSEQFAHAGGVIVITPEGKVGKYFYGIDYAPKDLKFGIMESADNKVGNPAEQLLLYCYHYDPSTGKYGLAIMNVVRLGAIATLLGLGGMFFIFWRYKKVRDEN
jgi:protein SCO1/2